MKEGRMQQTSLTGPATPPAQPDGYFDFQAEWGMTKHFGGVAVTDQLLTQCAVAAGAPVLEVGCGVGQTACHVAEAHGCSVVAVDLSPRMIGWARRRVVRRNLEHAIRFTVADAQCLPFADHSFAAVICESVLAFAPAPERALAEYARVRKPGGYVGLTEGIWLKPPPPELEAYLERALGNARFRSLEEYRAADRSAGAGGGPTHPGTRRRPARR
jgi:ubiquinone/menaquinone biosynthesis C-methylase UbiE